VVDGGFSHAVEYETGARVDAINLSADPIDPGAQLRVRFRTGGFAGESLRLGLLTPTSSARQFVARGEKRSHTDARDVWVDVPLAPGVDVVLAVPEPWHARTAVLALEVRDGDSPVRVTRGPRGEAQNPADPGGRAILGLVEVNARPTRVVARRVSGVEIDGALGEWPADGEPLVESLDGEPTTSRAGGQASRVWLGWDDDALYLAAQLEDRDVHSSFERRDDPLWKEEALELFVARDAGGPYVELQVSPRNVQFDSRFASYRKGDEAWNGRWRSAVAVDGTVDRRGDRDRGWSVEMRVPWTDLCEPAGLACPMTEGALVRANVFRMDLPAGRGARQRGSALSPTRVPDFHAWDNAAVIELGGAS
jgi:hypothetical protein